MSHIAIAGSGGWGTAIAVLLANKGLKVRLWSYFKEESEQLNILRENKPFLPGIKLPDNIECTNDIAYCVKNAQLVISAAPSKGVRATARMLKDVMDIGKQVMVSISKGLEQDSLMRISQVIESEIPSIKLAVMSGPSHAEEVATGMPTTNVVSSHDISIAEYVQDIFMCDSFRVYTNPDMIGVELGGSLKNVIALCAGIVDGLGFGDNTKAALMTRGMAEIARLGHEMGGHLETFFGLTGMGDLIVTCTSMHSRNRRAGILIGQGKSVVETLEQVKMVVEGVSTTSAAYKLSKLHNIEMPIVNEAYKVLFENKPARDAVMSLMSRNRRHEMEEVVRHKFMW